MLASLLHGRLDMSSTENTPQTLEGLDDLDRSTLTEKSVREEARLLRWDAALRRAAAGEERVEAAHQRAEAARQRAEAAHVQADAAKIRAANARQQAESIRQDLDGLLDLVARESSSDDLNTQQATADQRDRAADERERLANDRERMADEREAEADERESLADRREAEADERERLANVREAQHRRADERVTTDRRSERPTLPGVPRHENRRVLDEEGAALRAQAAAVAESLADEAESVAAAFEDSAAREGREWRMKIAATEREIARTLRANARRFRQPRSAHERFEPPCLSG